jgi:hypothetical protein
MFFEETRSELYMYMHVMYMYVCMYVCIHTRYICLTEHFLLGAFPAQESLHPAVQSLFQSKCWFNVPVKHAAQVS